MSGIRYTKQDNELIAYLEEKTGIGSASGVVKMGLRELAAKFQTGSFLTTQGWPDGVGRQMLVDSLDGDGQVRPLESLALGSVVCYPQGSDVLYVLSGKHQAASMDTVCTLRPLAPGGQVRRVDDGTLAELLGPLDERLPVSALRLNDFEVRVVGALAHGPLVIDQLYRTATSFVGRDTTRMKISKSQIGPFVGRLLSGLAAAGLIEFAGNNPLETAWSLSERGRELVKLLKLEG